MRDCGACIHQHGPRNWLCRAQGAPALSGGKEPHEVGDCGGESPLISRGRDRLCRAQGAPAPSGGKEPHAVGDCGGESPPLISRGRDRLCRAQGAPAPSGGNEPHAVRDCGGESPPHQQGPRPALPGARRTGPLGGQGATRSARPWGPYLLANLARLFNLVFKIALKAECET